MNNMRGRGLGSIPPVVKNLLIINIGMFALSFIIDYIVNGNSSLVRQLGLYYRDSPYFEPYQIITHMFMHGSFMHILFNMYALWMFGKVLEMVWGPKRFFIYYMATGLGAAFLHLTVLWWQFSGMQEAISLYSQNPSPDAFTVLVNDFFPEYYKQIYDKLLVAWSSDVSNQTYINRSIQFLDELYALKINIPTVGASGAVFGLLLGFGMLFPNVKLVLLFPPIPIKAKYFVIFYGLFELYLGISNNPSDNIAHFAHLGGMIFGFILIKYWNIKPPQHF